MVIAVLAFSLAACGEMADTNRNANANANMANANANTNANREMASSNSNDNRRSPTREEYDRDKDRYLREAREAGRTVGSGINDGWLWVKTRFELAAADDLRDSTVNVDVDNDTVTLTGTVATQEQRASAERIAKSIEGVKAVKNMLKVAPSGSNANANK
jgi:hypothetical protein